MARAVAFDWGDKRTGVAYTDELKMIASPLETVDTKTIIPFVKKLTEEWKIDTFVVGVPDTLFGKPTDSSAGIQSFIQELQKDFPNIQIATVDESFSSREAMQAMVQGGMKKSKRREKGQLDAVSATIILQRFLASKV